MPEALGRMGRLPAARAAAAAQAAAATSSLVPIPPTPPERSMEALCYAIHRCHLNFQLTFTPTCSTPFPHLGSCWRLHCLSCPPCCRPGVPPGLWRLDLSRIRHVHVLFSQLHSLNRGCLQAPGQRGLQAAGRPCRPDPVVARRAEAGCSIHACCGSGLLLLQAGRASQCRRGACCRVLQAGMRLGCIARLALLQLRDPSNECSSWDVSTSPMRLQHNHVAPCRHSAGLSRLREDA